MSSSLRVSMGRQDAAGRALSDSEIAEYRDALKGLEPVGREYQESARRLHDLTPDTTFEEELRDDLGGREVQVRFLGRGNTAGDAIVFLPKERILASGDLVVHPVPYLGGGCPAEFVATLRRLRDLEPLLIVPGQAPTNRRCPPSWARLISKVYQADTLV